MDSRSPLELLFAVVLVVLVAATGELLLGLVALLLLRILSTLLDIRDELAETDASSTQ